MKENSAARELVAYLTEHDMTVSCAESLTGGLIAAAIVSVPGASRVLNESYVTYSDEAKHRILGVSFDTIRKEGVVSGACAREMAEGLEKLTGCGLSISATGLAGPGGALPGRPVGTVYLGFSSAGRTEVRELHLKGDRESVRQETVAIALSLGLLFLKGEQG